VTRRSFLEACVGVVPVLRHGQAPPKVVNPTGLTSIYAAESWNRVIPNAPFVVGMLITRTPDAHANAIVALKERTKYKRRLTHHTNDRRKIECVRELMHYFARDPELRFAARVVGASNSALLASADVRTSAYVELFAVAKVPPAAILHSKQRPYRERRNRAAIFDQSEYDTRVSSMTARTLIVEHEEIGWRPRPNRADQTSDPAEVRRRNALRNALLELSCVLTGALFRAQITPNIYSDSPMRRAMAVRLMTQLGVESLNDRVDRKWEPSFVVAKEGRTG
jgi:hypothetical protein